MDWRGPAAFAVTVAIGLAGIVAVKASRAEVADAQDLPVDEDPAAHLPETGCAPDVPYLRGSPVPPRTRTADEDEGSEAEEGTVRIRVVTPEGKGVAGVDVVSDPCLRSWGKSLGRTDARGLLVERDLPTDGSVRVGVDETWVPVTAGDVTLTATGALPMRFRFVDAQTGAPLPLQPDLGTSEGVLVRRSDARDAIRRAVPYPSNSPDGYVAFDDPSAFTRPSWYAQRVAAIYPLRCEAHVEVVARNAQGKPVEGPLVAEFQVGEAEVSTPEVQEIGEGRFRLRRIPFLAGERLRLGLAEQEGPPEPEDVGDVMDEEKALEDPTWEGVLPRDGDAVLRVEVAVPESRSAHSWGWTRIHRCGCGRRERRGPVGDLDVTARRRDGSLARWASFVVERTCEAGEARDRRSHRDVRSVQLNGEGRTGYQLPVGTWNVILAEPGLVPAWSVVCIEENAVAHVELVEPRGATIEVEVRDWVGRPRPFALLEVTQPSEVAWADLADDGTERLDHFVDHLGRRTLVHVEPGEVRLTATWAGRTVEKTVTVADGETARVRIDVP